MLNKDSNLLRILKLNSSGVKFAPYHLYEYSQNTLKKLLNKCNFSIISSRKTLLIPEYLQSDKHSSILRSQKPKVKSKNGRSLHL